MTSNKLFTRDSFHLSNVNLAKKPLQALCSQRNTLAFFFFFFLLRPQSSWVAHRRSQARHRTCTTAATTPGPLLPGHQGTPYLGRFATEQFRQVCRSTPAPALSGPGAAGPGTLRSTAAPPRPQLPREAPLQAGRPACAVRLRGTPHPRARGPSPARTLARRRRWGLTAETGSECAGSVLRHFPVFTSQILTLSSN